MLDSSLREVCSDALVEYSKTIIPALDIFSSRISASADTPPFLHNLEEQEFRSAMMQHSPNEDTYSLMTTLACGCGNPTLAVRVHILQKTDHSRVAIAKLADAVQGAETCVAIENDGDAETLHITGDMINALDKAKDAVDKFENYMDSDIGEKDDKEIKVAMHHLKDAQSLLRLYVARMQSKWVAGLQKTKTNLEKCVPEDWRSYTLLARDDEMIVKNIVENQELLQLLPRRSALQKSVETFESVTRKFNGNAATLDTGKMPTGIDDLLEEAKLMVAIRAACSVTFEKLPLCKNQKSRAATLRETKRLISALEVEIPTAITKMMDDAAV